MSLIVTGTDTEVGKTVVSAVLLARYRRHRPAYWKPLATGDDPTASNAEPTDRESIRRWLAKGLGNKLTIHDASYTFAPPVSPHLAARQAGVVIEPETLLATWRRLQATGRPIVVEGIGGVLVPLDDRGTLLVDLLAALRLPCLVVARSTLGTINHSLLTLEALRARGVPIAGMVMNGPHDPENRAIVQQLGDVERMLELPRIEPIDAAGIQAAAEHFDPNGVLTPYFTR